MAHTCFRGNQRNQFLKEGSQIEIAFDFAKICLSWEGGDAVSMPQEEASPILEETRANSHRGPEQGEGKGEEGTRLELQ